MVVASKCFAFRAWLRKHKFEKVLSWKLDTFTLPVYPLLRWLKLGKSSETCCIYFFCLRWHFKWEKPILLESNFISKQELITHTSFVYKTLQLVRISLLNTTLNKELCFFLRKVILYRASDISRGRGPAKFRYFREIPQKMRNTAKSARNISKYLSEKHI